MTKLPLLLGQLGAVAAHRQHDRFDVLALAVDQRAVEIEQEGGRRLPDSRDRFYRV